MKLMIFKLLVFFVILMVLFKKKFKFEFAI